MLALLRRITPNHKEDFYCLNCFHSYTTKVSFKSIIKYARIMIIVMEKCLMETMKYLNTTTVKSL